MSRLHGVDVRLSLLACVALWHAAGASAADAPPTPGVSPGHSVQRIFVPADQPETWPLGEDQYVPATRDDWDQLVKRAREYDDDNPPAAIIQADYTLHLSQQNRLTGEAVLSVRLPHERPTFTPLVPLSPRVTELTTSNTERSPLVGNWLEEEDAAQLGVLLQQSGEIRFRFVQVGVKTGGGVRFALGLPGGVRQTMTLQTPGDVDVQLDRALLMSRTELATGDLQWVFLASPGGRRELRIQTAEQPADESGGQVRYSQEESYRLATHGLSYDTTFTVRSVDDRELELELQVSDELKLLQATVDGLPAPWTSGGFSPSSRIVLPPTGQPHTLRLRGAARIVLDQPWELPTVRLRDAQWTEGAVRLWVDARVELLALNPLDAHLESVLGIGVATPAAEIYRLQAWNVQSGIEIAASRPQQTMSVDLLSEVVLDDVVDSVQTTLLFQGRRPNDFHAVLPIAPAWQVESVDSMPTGEVLHWRVVEEDERRVLQVQFRTAPTRRDPLVLKVAGRRRDQPIDLPAPAGDFIWLDTSQYRLQQNLLWLSGRQSDDRIVAASTSSTSSAVADEMADKFRVAKPGSSTVALELSATAQDATVDLERRAPTYEAESVVAVAAGEQLSYQIELLCHPLQGAVRDLPVVFSRPLPSSAQWSLGDGGPTLAVTPLDAPAQTDVAGDPQPSVYRVYLPEPVSQPFRLTVAYRRPREAIHAIDGAILPDAEPTQCWAILLGDPEKTQVAGRNCSPAPIPGRDATVLTQLPRDFPILGAYRYDENYPLRLGLAPLLIERTDAGSTTDRQNVLCDWVERVSLHAADGQIRCRGSYSLTSREQDAVNFTFPTEVRDIEAWIDQNPAVVIPSPNTPRQVRVLLPSRSDAFQLTIEFFATSAGLDEQTHAPDPWPTPSFPTPTGRWTVWTPPRYLVEPAEAESLTIVERLFGPLTRAAEERPFFPWQSAAWQLPARLTSVVKPPSRDVELDVAHEAPGPDPDMQPLKIHGWRATELTVVGAASPPRLVVPARQQIVWKAYWLLAAVTGVGLSRAIPRRVGLLIFAMVVFCLIAPRGWLVLPQAAWLGLAVGWLTAQLYEKLDSIRRPLGHATTLTVSLLLVLATLPTDLAAAESIASPPHVLIPIDQQGEPAGDTIYVPAELLRRLQAREAGDPYDQHAAVLTDGRWQLVLPGQNDLLPPERCSLTLRGDTFRPGASLTLPLRQGDAAWSDGSHRLNGAPVEIEWLDDDGCRIPLGMPGEFELKLFFRPQIRQENGRETIQLATPRLPASEVLLRGIAQVDDVVVADAVEVTQEENLGQATALLPATDQLLVSWRPRTTLSRRVRVEQLQWLSIRPAGSQSDALIRLTGVGNAPEELVLEISADLALAETSEQEDRNPVREIILQNNRVLLQIEPGTPLPLEIPLSFQLKRTVSIGRIQMPRIQIPGIEVVRSWFAASIDNRLNYEESSGLALRRVPASEFADRWGAADRQPATAWAVGKTPIDWSIRVWPRQSPLVAEQTLRLLRRPHHWTVDYLVDIAGRQEAESIYRFKTPPDFRLQGVAVTRLGDDTPVPIRFSVSEPGEVSVFLGEPLREAHRVSLAGEQLLATDKPQPLPRFRLRDAELSPLTLLLDRDRQVDVRLSGSGFAAVEMPDEAPSPDFARVGAYQLDDRAFESAQLKTTSNRVQASAETALCVVPDRQPATIELWVALSVQQGIVDRLTLLAPSELTNPVLIEGGESAVAGTTLDQSVQRIECFLPEGVTAGQQRLLRIRTELAAAADRRIRLPDVRLAMIDETARYVVLPSMLKDRSLHWVWDNLYPHRLPSALAGAGAGRSVSFRVTGESFSAEQQIRPDSLRRVQMRSAEVSAVVDRAGHVVATSRYVLQPGNVERCKLRLPEGAELLSLSVGGRPVAASPDNSTLPPIALSPPLMPIEIAARYRYALPPHSARLTLTAPELEIAGRAVPTPVRWEITPAEGLQLVGSGSAKKIDRRSFLELGRRQRWDSVQQASLLALQLPAWEARQWYEQWQEEFAPLASQSDLPEDESGSMMTGTHWEMLAERFEPNEVRRSHTGRRPAPPASRDAAYLTTRTGTLDLQISRRTIGWHRWLLAAGLVGVVAAGRRYRPWSTRAIDYLAERKELIALAAGLCWWYWLTPSIFGATVAIVAAVLYGQRMATRRRPADDEVAQ